MKITKTIIAISTLAMMMASCHQGSEVSHSENTADSLIEVVAATKDFEHMIVVVDSLEALGDLPSLEANLKRGWAFHKMKQYTKAEKFYNKVLKARIRTADEEETYQMAAGYLADLLYIKHDYEGALRTAIPVIKRMESQKGSSADAIIVLLTSVGRCQMKLNRINEAAETFEKAYQCNMQLVEADTTGMKVKNAIVHTANIAIRFLNAKSFDKASMWLTRTEDLLERFAQTPASKPAFVSEYHARLHIYKAFALQNIGRSEEAAAEYDAFLQADYAKTDDGRADACEYLIAAQRYREAADNLKELDRMMDEWGYKLTLDNIQGYLLIKYRANLGAGRQDSAYAVAQQICEALDTAITWQKNSDAAELATIYDTQQKETIIERQRADINRIHIIGLAIALGLISIFFVLYIIYRRRTMRRLAEKNQQLKLANERANESSKMKSDFIKQISHEIRTPLNILSGFTQIITADGMQLDDVTRQDINRQITDNTDRITGLVNKMLELSDAGSQTVIDRCDQAPASQIATQAVVEAGIAEQNGQVSFELQIDANAETVMLQTNVQQATRALSLLLDNARKFTAQGQIRLRVITLSPIQSDTQQKSVTSETPKIRFIVEDTGIGVPANQAEHIFEEFVQLDTYYDGTGIGLTIARSIARKLGGDITLDTTYTNGARFIMTL